MKSSYSMKILPSYNFQNLYQPKNNNIDYNRNNYYQNKNKIIIIEPKQLFPRQNSSSSIQNRENILRRKSPSLINKELLQASTQNITTEYTNSIAQQPIKIHQKINQSNQNIIKSMHKYASYQNINNMTKLQKYQATAEINKFNLNKINNDDAKNDFSLLEVKPIEGLPPPKTDMITQKKSSRIYLKIPHPQTARNKISSPNVNRPNNKINESMNNYNYIDYNYNNIIDIKNSLDMNNSVDANKGNNCSIINNDLDWITKNGLDSNLNSTMNDLANNNINNTFNNVSYDKSYDSNIKINNNKNNTEIKNKSNIIKNIYFNREINNNYNNENKVNNLIINTNYYNISNNQFNFTNDYNNGNTDYKVNNKEYNNNDNGLISCLYNDNNSNSKTEKSNKKDDLNITNINNTYIINKIDYNINNNEFNIINDGQNNNEYKISNDYPINNVNQNNISNQNNIVTNINQIIDPESNFNLSEFVTISQIGKGTEGTIYSVKWKKNNKKYALKKGILRLLETVQKRKEEIKMLKNFRKNTGSDGIIITFGELCVKNKLNYYDFYELMELAEMDWDHEIYNRAQIHLYYEENELIDIMAQIVKTFSLLQKNHITHRDIKPQNIMIVNGKFKICDFGNARILKREGMVVQRIRGSEMYMSPIMFQAFHASLQQVKHHTFKSDVFSLGMCFLLAAALSYTPLNTIREMYDMNAIKKVIVHHLGTRYSQKILKILFSMLQIEERLRPDFIQLEPLFPEGYNFA